MRVLSVLKDPKVQLVCLVPMEQLGLSACQVQAELLVYKEYRALLVFLGLQVSLDRLATLVVLDYLVRLGSQVYQGFSVKQEIPDLQDSEE
jgi:hypothetical protein